ncbi:MAG: TRAP transporter TatT component family protein, partial [Myxococcota bacterium]|nr:TRAP transporter TatT component family protein [Myxococcota bacterium]
GDKPADAVFALQKDDQMAIYWTASNLGKWARMQGFSTLVKYKGYVAAMMSHCLDLDKTAYYGGPPRYWGAFYAAAPAFAGGDMDKSRESFEEAKAMYPENFATWVLYADYYAKKKQDKELFRTLLQHVVDTPSDVLPDMIPEQNVEKQKAQKLLDQIGDLFAE